MKIPLTIQKASVPLKTVLPSLLGATMLTIEKLFLHVRIGDSSILNDPQGQSSRLFELLYSTVKGLEITIFESYNNYFAFILMMLCVNVLIEGFMISRSLFQKRKEQSSCPWSTMSQNLSAEKVKQIMISTLKSIIIYSLIYCFYQAAWVCLGLLSSGSALIKDLDQLQTLPFQQRVLAEESFLISDYLNDDDQIFKKPSLSIGKVLSEVDIEVYNMILSKDGKTAFTISNFDADLIIVDLSDWEAPTILSTLKLTPSSYALRHRGLLLSPDETKLYISSVDILQVMDVSDLRSPVSLNVVKDKNLEKGGNVINGEARARLLASKDHKFLFAAGEGLQVFDISKPTAPVCVSSNLTRIDSGRLIPTNIALSQDKKTLYYSDGSLWIYDISDPMNLKIKNSFNATFLITSVRLSRDAKTAYITGLSSGQKKILIQKLEISAQILAGKVIELDQASSVAPVFIEQTMNDFYLFLQIDGFLKGDRLKLVTFDINEERLVFHNKHFVKNDGLSVLLTEDSEKLLFGGAKKLKVVDLYLDYPNKNAFTESSNIVQTYTNTGINKFIKFAFAPDSNNSVIYSVSSGSSAKPYIFGMQKINSNNQLSNTALYQTNDDITELGITKDNKRAYWISSTKTASIVDISDPKNVTLLSQYKRSGSSFDLTYFVLTQDGKIGYLSYPCYEYLEKRVAFNLIEVVDFSSDPANPTKLATIRVEQEAGCLRLSSDERTLFISGQLLTIFNVTNPESPVLLANQSLPVQGMNKARNEMLLSHDEKTLFIKEGTGAISYTLRIIDVSVLTSPKIKSEFRLPMSTSGPAYYGRAMELSADSKTIYVMRDASLIVVDASNPVSPRYLGGIKTLEGGSDDYMVDFRLGADGKKGYIISNKGKLLVVGIQPVYSTFIVQDTLLLGERYTMDLMVLKLDKNIAYNAMDVDYRFMKFLMVESRSSQSSDFANATLKMLPSWIEFDFKTQALTVEARRKSDIKTFTFYAAFSTRISAQVFEDNGILDVEEAWDLIASLLSLGYLDNQLFLTENFGSYKDFILPNSYSTIKQRVYNVMKQFSFETYNELNIIQSLNLKREAGKLAVTTPSLNPLKVDICLKMENPKQAQFLSRSYGSLFPTITDLKSRIILEGTPSEVNLALEKVVVNLENITSCDGEITINDKLNPIVIQNVKNISRLFNHNKPPGLNKTYPLSIQGQVEKNPVYTGQYFQIKLDQNTFSDNYTLVESLNYQVVLAKKDVSETLIPSWITFNDMTLTGTAPEIMTGRDFELKIIAKNEFQQFKVPFILHVNLSTVFYLKLAMKYSPYLLSVLTLLISFNRIYNILGKKYYRHPKDFSVRIGEEVTSEVIFPVSFIAKEVQEALKILELLENEISEERGGRVTMNDLLSHFIGQDSKLDKQKLMEKVDESLRGLSSQEKFTTFDLYLNGSVHQKSTVRNLILNHFVVKQLESKEEVATKVYYEKIKMHWQKFVEWDSKTSSFKFIHEKFDNYTEADNTKESTVEIPLLSQGINVELLKDKILADAFDNQNINILPNHVQFLAKEKMDGPKWKQFTKFDLENLPFNEPGKVGYGIRYTKKFNTLYFHGLVEDDFRNKTIVLQIVNMKQKILKELWISCEQKQFANGGEDGNRERQSFHTLNELKARGKDYEAF